MDYIKLSECAYYSDLRTKYINLESYISTENMLPNKGGVIPAESIPDVKSTSKYEPEDILISNIRPYFCKIWFADKCGSCSNDVLVIKAKTDWKPKFLYYVLSDQNFFNYDTVTSKGTKMPRGTPNAIMKYLVPNVNESTQQRIVDILSAYDTLIENNNKRIKILEQMAENLYKEWFVRFRFPGHETTQFKNGIPKGWILKRIDEIAKIKAGGDRPDICENLPINDCKIPVFSNGIENDGLYGFTKEAMVFDDSITISARGTVGFVCLRRTPFVPIVRLLAITPKIERTSAILLYYQLKNDVVIGNGTSQQQITVPMIGRKKILIPEKLVAQKFFNKSEYIWDEIDSLKKQTTNLIKQRDLLLPRLMSGKLAV